MRNTKILTIGEDLKQHKAFIRVYKDYDEIRYKLETAGVAVDLKDTGSDIQFEQALCLAECLDIPLFTDI